MMNKHDLWVTEPNGDILDQTKKEKIKRMMILIEQRGLK